MADDLADSGKWRDTAETRLGKLEATVEEQKRLRAAMDSDMGDLKAALGADRRLFKAIRDTQSDHTKRLTRLESKVDTLETKVDTLETKVDLVHVGVVAIRDLLERDDGSAD